MSAPHFLPLTSLPEAVLLRVAFPSLTAIPGPAVRGGEQADPVGASSQPHSRIWEPQLLLLPTPAPILPILPQWETFLCGVSAKRLKPSSLPWGSLHSRQGRIALPSDGGRAGSILAVPGRSSCWNQPCPHPAQEQEATRKSVESTNGQPGSHPPRSFGKGENNLPLQTVHLSETSSLHPSAGVGCV